MMHVFGDIFRFNEDYFVFLASTDEIIYAAKIIDPEKVKQINSLNDKRAAHPNAYRTNGHELYWYVELTTENFIDHAAHLHKTEQEATKILYFEMIGKKLNEDDQTNLKNELLKEDCPVSKGLKKMIAEI